MRGASLITVCRDAFNQGLKSAIILLLGLFLVAAPASAVVTVAPVAGSGVAGFSGDGGPALSAMVYYPYDVAADTAGNQYFVDTYNQRIRRVDALTGIITTVAGSGAVGFSGDGGSALAASLNYPQSIAVDAAGNLYIADTNNHRIRRVDASTGIITTVAGSGAVGFSGDGASALSAGLINPQGIAVDTAGNLYIADTNNHRIRRVDASTGIITTIAGKGRTTTQVWNPPYTYWSNSATRVWVPGYQHCYWGCHWHSGYWQYTGGYVTRPGYYSTTTAPYPVGDGGSATNAGLYYPRGVAVDSSGNVFIADGNNNRIRRVDAGTGIISSIDSGKYSFDLDVDGVGNVYFMHWNSGNLYQWDAATAVSSVKATVPNGMGVGVQGGDIFVTSLYGHQIYKVGGLAALNNQPPVADAGVPQTVECSGGSSANVTLDGSASSDPDGDALTYSWSWNGSIQASGMVVPTSFPLGTTTVTLTVDDGKGGTSTATTTVTVQDTTPPTVNAGADVTVEATSTAGADYDVSVQVTASDSCCNVSTNIAPVGTYPMGATTVTVDATDCSGNSASDQMVVTVQDTTVPVFTLVPADVTVEATGPQVSVAIGAATATDIFGATVTSDAPATFPVGTTVVTWTAADPNGNSSTATQTVTVTDTTAPVITAPADVNVEANAVSSTVAIGTATASDLVDGAVNVSNDAPATFPLGTTVVTYTATDAAGNATTATQSVTVVDTTAPALTVPANVTAEATGPQTAVAIGTATATDIFGATVTSDAPATFPVGTTVVTWTAADPNGNSSTATQTVTVTDTTAPVITAPADANVEANAVSSTVAIGTATASDLVDGVVSVSNDAPATFPLGTTVVTYTATDAAGNTATATQSVTVVDTTAPALTVPANVTTEATGPQTAVAIGAATATDIFGATVTSDAPATFPVGTTTVTYTATDGNGLTTVGTQTVTVTDTTAPVITAPADVNVEANAVSSTVAIGTATASDLVDGVVSVSNDAPATFPLGTTVVTYTATDAAGNTATATQSVTVVDTTAPALTVPGNVSVEANAVLSSVDIGVASATDIFGATVANNAPATFPLGTTTVTYTATDGNGLTTTGTQTVTVVDTTVPVLTVPADVTTEANAVLSTVDIGVATATDIFGATVTSDAPATFALGTTTVTYTATDGNGLTTTGTQTVTVVDTTAPVLTVPADVSVDANGYPNSTVDLGEATATDIFAVTITNDAPEAGFPIGETTVTWTATDASGNATTATQLVTVDARLASLLLEKAEVEWREMTDESGVKFGMSEVKAKGTVELPLWMPLSTITPDALLTIGLGGVPNLLSEQVAFSVKGDKWRYKVKTAVGIQKLEIEWKGSEFKFKDAASGVELESESDDASDTSLSLETKGHDVMLTVNGVTLAVTGGVVSSSYPFDKDEDGEVTFELPFALTPDMVIALTIDGVAQDVAVLDHTTAARGKFELKAEVNAGSMDGTSGNGTLDLGLSLGSVAIDGTDSVSGWSNKSGKEWKVKKRHHK